MKFNLIVLILCAGTLTSCDFSNEELKKGWWKYGGGEHLGDVLNFEHLTVINDTIYRGETAKSVIVDREDKFFGMGSRKIFVKSIIPSESYIEAGLDKGVGVYYQK